jgi:23S rRNA (adenine2030-N6)-methyltransferase
MLSYRHGFHAGNRADVHKHAALALALRHLRRKDAPFCVIDAFAGDGVYDLTSAEALKTAEFRAGIAKIWRRTDAPAGVDGYLDRVRAANAAMPNAGGRLIAYPGSPALARASLRADDRLILGELHPTAHEGLKRWARNDARIAVHRRDGFELLGALVPPPVRRGAALVDPAYEVKAEYETLPPALARALHRWKQGIYLVWYPVLAEARHRAMVEALAALPAASILQSELGPASPPAAGMQASGLVILNPPWQFDAELQTAGDWLAAALWPAGKGRYEQRWLKRAEGGAA